MARTDDPRRASVALEDAFFAKENAGLLDELRRKSDDDQRRELLREVVKIQDAAFLNRLITLGMRPETALAVKLIPLVFVAWADDKLDEREKNAVLEAAQQCGVTGDRIATQLLKNWLAKKPDPRLLVLWKTYVRKLWGCFTADERWQMRQNLLRSARGVAETAGGILGLTSKISAQERRVLDELDALLD